MNIRKIFGNFIILEYNIINSNIFINMTERELNEMSKDERIKYFYSLPLVESEDEAITPFIVDGDIDEWAEKNGFISLQDALQKLSDIGSKRDNS